MYSTRTHVNTLIPNGHPRKEKHAFGQKSDGQFGVRRGMTYHCARRTRRLLRTEVGEEVRVAVGPVEYSYIRTQHVNSSMLHKSRLALSIKLGYHCKTNTQS